MDNLADSQSKKVVGLIVFVVGFIGVSDVMMRIAQSAGVEDRIATLVGIATLLTGVIVFFIGSRILDERNRFKVANDSGGASVVYSIIKANDKLLLTAFSDEVPSAGYLGIVNHHIAATPALSATRYWTKSTASDPSRYAWIEKVPGDLKKLNYTGNNYTDIRLRDDICIPLNFIVVDNREVWLFLPSEGASNNFNRSIHLKGEEAATLFTAAANWLRTRCEYGKSMSASS